MESYDDDIRVPEAPGRGRLFFTEKKFGEGTLALWEFADLPEDAVLTHVVLFPYRGERPVLPWRDNRTSLPEGEVKPGESAEEAIRRIANEQAGILDLTPTHLGHFRCRATVYQTELEPGAVTYRAVYGVDVASLADSPADSNFGRRMVLQRELMHLVRERYFEHYKEYTEALDKFVIQRAKERAGSA